MNKAIVTYFIVNPKNEYISTFLNLYLSIPATVTSKGDDKGNTLNTKIVKSPYFSILYFDFSYFFCPIIFFVTLLLNMYPMK